MIKRFIIILLLIIAGNSFGQNSTPLLANLAFKFSATLINSSTIAATWQIAPGYYLYREHFQFALPDTPDVRMGKITFPAGIPKTDDLLGHYEVYENQVTIHIPLQSSVQKITLQATYQGCSSAGFCYPPQTRRIVLLPPGTQNQQAITQTPLPGQRISAIENPPSDHITRLLHQHNIPLIFLGFLGFGLLLAFTPCVLPMIPILSSIIIGHGRHLTTLHAFLLSLVYVLAMSFTYAIAGIIAGFAGNSIQAAWQNVWVIGFFSFIFVLLALSLFGFYEIHLPARLQQRIDTLSRRQKSGSYIGVAVMGCLATLIVSPCITPPLVGALGYIGQTGNAWLGGLALFALGFGMGIPLLVIGTTGSKLLPKAGIWTNTIKNIFGVIMLVMALWLLSRILPATIQMILWAILAISCAVYMGAFNTTPPSAWHKLWKGLGLCLFIYGTVLLIGATLGSSDLLQPLARLNLATVSNMPATTIAGVSFQKIKSQEDLNRALQTAKLQHKSVMLDFYADWCEACRIMDRNVFNNPAIRAALRDSVLLRADVTANDRQDQNLMRTLGVFAPPTILFFDHNGKESTQNRIVGETNKDDFLKNLHAL